ncbi:hypothetical protein Bca4012_042255 [Brassica carinata]
MNVDATSTGTAVPSTTTNTSTIDNLHFDSFMNSPNQLNFTNDQEANTKIQETLFSHKTPLFMVDQTLPVLEGMFSQNIITNNNKKNNYHDTRRGGRGGVLEQSFLTNNTEEWDMNLSQQEPFQVPTMVSHLFNNSTSSNTETVISYNLPALVEGNVDNISPLGNSAQDGDMASTIECLKKQELSYDQWIDSQQCSNFFLWDNLNINVEGSSLVGNQDPSMTLESSALSSSFPSSF